MGSLSDTKLLLLLSHLAYLLVVATSTPHYPTLPHSPAEPPSNHHHHHHHHHSHSPVSAPAYYPPVHPPTQLPHPPVKPPVHHPVHSPTHATHPPVKSPVHPVHSPTHATHPPLKTPVHLPTKPPVISPTKPPAYHPTPRKSVAIEGVVYCKNCTYFGVDTLLSAKPLSGARVVLKCKNTVYTTKKSTATDKNGYFFMEAPKTVTSYGSRKCHVYLAEPPVGSTCIHPTNLNGGVSGALLFKPGKTNNISYALFDVGPFAFEPPKPYCRKN